MFPGLTASIPAVKHATPSGDWCAVINSAQPGDEVVLARGDYSQPCWIRASGSAGAYIVIRSESENAATTFSYAGSTANIIEVYGSYLTIRGFTFRPNSDVVHSLRIRGGAHNITVERNVFTGYGNVAVSANSGSTADLVIRYNEFKNVEATPVYVGCHDGDCVSSNLLFERNFIDGVRASDPGSIGYGIEVKLNSWGVIRDNTIANTKGPPIMAYGSSRGDRTLIEGNYVEGSRAEAGIVLGGGPAIVRNNIAVGNANGGISAQNYGGRNLQRDIWIIHNTLINNGDSGISTQGWTSSANNVIAYNAVLSKFLTPLIRPANPAGIVMGNVSCPASCFVNATTAPYDFTPAARSPLIGAAPASNATWKPADDFMGVSRNVPADAGALERRESAGDRRVSRFALRPPRLPVR